MSTLKVDLDLVQKYNVAGPRYTSYPPATKFTDAFKWPELAEKISENAEMFVFRSIISLHINEYLFIVQEKSDFCENTLREHFPIRSSLVKAGDSDQGENCRSKRRDEIFRLIPPTFCPVPPIFFVLLHLFFVLYRLLVRPLPRVSKRDI